jgi:GT2 family glycosyltransferase
MKLSIIILNYHSLEVIKECLNSFEKYPPKVDYEIIIANNDDKKQEFNDFATRYPQIKFIQNTGNWGFSSGCNLGASVASGEYLLFLNPDTRLNETPAIDKMLEVLENDKSVGICGCRTVTSKGIGNEISWSSPWLLIRWIRAIHKAVYSSKNAKRFQEDKNIWYPDWVGGSAVTVKNDDFEKISGWSDDKYWMYCEDPDICSKMHKIMHKKSALIRNCTIEHIGGGASKTNDEQTLMLKMEMIISSHNYIYHNSNKLSRLFILSTYVLKSFLSPIIKMLLSALLFNKKHLVKNKYFAREITKYYIKSIKRKTWRSDKLEYEKK